MWRAGCGRHPDTRQGVAAAGLQAAPGHGKLFRLTFSFGGQKQQQREDQLRRRRLEEDAQALARKQSEIQRRLEEAKRVQELADQERAAAQAQMQQERVRGNERRGVLEGMYMCTCVMRPIKRIGDCVVILDAFLCLFGFVTTYPLS